MKSPWSYFPQCATILLAVLLLPRFSAAQSKGTSSRTWTLADAVSYALQHYPSVRSALERLNAAQAGIGVAKTSYLPQAGLLWQTNRATDNNISGLVLPNGILPSISGPVAASASNHSVWGSAAGLLFSWVAYDFGYRGATVSAAQAARDISAAESNVTRLDVAVAATNAYLTLLAAEQQVRIAQADVQRRDVFAKSTQVLVQNQLRPGADYSRAEADLAAARISLAQANQRVEVSRAALATALGMAGNYIEISPEKLLMPPGAQNIPPSPVVANPIAAAQQARVAQRGAQLHVIGRSGLPTVAFQSAVYGRGSGANPDGTLMMGTNGLAPSRENWAAGMSVYFPVSEILTTRAQKSVALAQQRAEEARYLETLQQLTGQLAQARASLEGARQVAAETPVELTSARAAEAQARARYQAGLGTVVEVSEAESLLVQAQGDDVLARLAVWQNLASVAAAQGNLQPFLQSVEQPAP